MTEQTEQACVWPFAECYHEKFGGLPPSQQREAYKRLTTRRRNPLTPEPPEQCAEPSDEIVAVLTAVNAAYLNKKQRSKQASATKRMIQRAHSDNVAAEQAEAVFDAAAAISLEPAEITAEEPAPEPAPAPARVPALCRATAPSV